ncbi:MAG: DUF4267 domain-containing protein [Pseudomonadota bacterium]
MSTSTIPMVRTVGFWLAAVMAVLQALNAIRAFTDPAGFATYMGLPLADLADAGFVGVYGLRTAFIAGLIVVLLATKRLHALAWMAGVAILMPAGDAWLTWQAGADSSIVARHAAIMVYVILAFVFLQRAAERVA